MVLVQLKDPQEENYENIDEATLEISTTSGPFIGTYDTGSHFGMPIYPPTPNNALTISTTKACQPAYKYIKQTQIPWNSPTP